MAVTDRVAATPGKRSPHARETEVMLAKSSSYNDVRLRVKEYLEHRDGTPLAPIDGFDKFFHAANRLYLIIIVDRGNWIGIPRDVLRLVKLDQRTDRLMVAKMEEGSIIRLYEGELSAFNGKMGIKYLSPKTKNYELHLVYGPDKITVKENGIVIPKVDELRPSAQELSAAKSLGIKL